MLHSFSWPTVTAVAIAQFSCSWDTIFYRPVTLGSRSDLEVETLLTAAKKSGKFLILPTHTKISLRWWEKCGRYIRGGTIQGKNFQVSLSSSFSLGVCIAWTLSETLEGRGKCACTYLCVCVYVWTHHFAGTCNNRAAPGAHMTATTAHFPVTIRSQFQAPGFWGQARSYWHFWGKYYSEHRLTSSLKGLVFYYIIKRAPLLTHHIVFFP